MKPKSKSISFRITQPNLDEVEKLAQQKQCDRSRILNEALSVRLKHLATKIETEQKMSKHINLFERNFVFIQRSFNDLNQLIKIAHVFKNEPIGHETQKHIEALLKHTQALEQSNLTILRNLSKVIEILEGKSSS